MGPWPQIEDRSKDSFVVQDYHYHPPCWKISVQKVESLPIIVPKWRNYHFSSTQIVFVCIQNGKCCTNRGHIIHIYGCVCEARKVNHPVLKKTCKKYLKPWLYPNYLKLSFLFSPFVFLHPKWYRLSNFGPKSCIWQYRNTGNDAKFYKSIDPPKVQFLLLFISSVCSLVLYTANMEKWRDIKEVNR